MATVLARICALHAQLQHQQQRAAAGALLSATDLAMLATIRAEIAELWPLRRAELAGAKAGHLVDVIRTEATFRHAPRLPTLRERAVGE